MVAWYTDYTLETARRLQLLRKLSTGGPTVQGAYQAMYADNPVQWIQDFCYTHDPRKIDGSKTIPFLLFPRQKEFILFLEDCRKNGENGLVEKCRDAGMTWICVCYSVWMWLYHPGSSISWGSRKEMLVDKIGDPNSIFHKIRFVIRKLPIWMLPAGFSARDHLAFMKIINPENGSTITGEAGDNIGRGGRSTMYFKDESAHYEHPESIEAALGDNTNVQIDISSVNGTGNVFYRRRMAGVEWRPGALIPSGVTRVFVFDWRDDPRKTQEWYDRRRKKAEDEALLHIFMQEVERDYTGSVVGVIIPQAWVKAAIDAHIKLGIKISGLRAAGQDIADNGGDLNGYMAKHGILFTRGSAWAGEAGDAARECAPLCLEDRVTELYYDCIGVGVGFRVEYNTMVREGVWPKHVRVYPWAGSAEVLDPDDNVIPGDPYSPTNGDQYGNLKAQSWFRTRTKFYKTYKAVTEGTKYSPDELISIDSKMPFLNQLCIELSQAVKKTGMNGKTIVDKTPDGTRSPNLADACIMVDNPCREVSILDVLG